MRVFVAGIFLALAMSSSAVGQSTNPKEAATKLQPGTYYWAGDTWTPMQSITLAGGGAKHVGKMFVPGLTPQMVWTFREREALIQIKDATPIFCVKFMIVPPGTPYAPSGRDIIIARFDEKKDHRELQTTSGGNVFTFKSGLSKNRMPDIETTEIDASTYLVTPKEPLKNGEYLLSNSSLGMTGYDFGFQEMRSAFSGAPCSICERGVFARRRSAAFALVGPDLSRRRAAPAWSSHN